MNMGDVVRREWAVVGQRKDVVGARVMSGVPCGVARWSVSSRESSKAQQQAGKQRL